MSLNEAMSKNIHIYMETPQATETAAVLMPGLHSPKGGGGGENDPGHGAFTEVAPHYQSITLTAKIARGKTM